MVNLWNKINLGQYDKIYRETWVSELLLNWNWSLKLSKISNLICNGKAVNIMKNCHWSEKVNNFNEREIKIQNLTVVSSDYVHAGDVITIKDSKIFPFWYYPNIL